MIYLGGLYLRHISSIIASIKSYTYTNKVCSTSNIGKILSKVDEDDMAILYDSRYRKLSIKISEICKTYPNKKALSFCSDRIEQLRYLDDKNFYTLNRSYHKPGRIYTKEGYAYKIGNYHQGTNKVLGNNKVIYSRKDNVIEEEFIKGRSIRILWIYPGLMFIIEHINSKNWIMNIDPEEEIVTTPLQNNSKVILKIVDDVKEFIESNLECKGIRSLTWGFDFIVGNKIGLLEINDMCGMPDNKDINIAFVDAILKIGNLK